MRDYGKVHSSFWSSDTIRSMSEDGRTLAIYLLTSPHSTIAGVFRLPDGYACEDLQWDAERVGKGFGELFDKGFANRCETTKWVWVVKHLDWNPPENPNQRKAVVKIARTIPDACAWKQAFMRLCGESPASDPEKPGNPSETLSEPFLNQKQEQEQEQEENTSSGKPDTAPSSNPVTPPGFVRFWSAWPRSPRKVAKAECLKRWCKRGLESQAGAIVADVEAMKATKQWRDGFDPAPLTYLNQRRWEDGEGDVQQRREWWIDLGYGDEAMARMDGHEPPRRAA